jgi:predicted NBD/HSP70 family sugar kinase
VSDSAAVPLAVGIDVGGTKLKVCAATQDGRVVAISEARGPAGRHTAQVLDDVQACFKTVMEAAAALLDQDVTADSLGLVTPGVIGENGIALTPNNPGMETSLPADTIAATLGVGNVAWANDVKAAAMADYQWGELQGARCGLYINLGTGLSAGAVIDGKPLMGANGAALEIGYMLPVSSSHSRGHCSGSAPLEDAVSGRALGDRALASTGEPATASEILGTWAKNPDAGTVLSELGAEFVNELIHMASNLAITLDPDIISIGGGVTAAADVFMPRLRDALDEFVPYPPAVTVSPMAGDLSMLGALLIAYQGLGAPVPPLCLPLPAAAHDRDETLRMPEPSHAGA